MSAEGTAFTKVVMDFHSNPEQSHLSLEGIDLNSVPVMAGEGMPSLKLLWQDIRIHSTLKSLDLSNTGLSKCTCTESTPWSSAGDYVRGILIALATRQIEHISLANNALGPTDSPDIESDILSTFLEVTMANKALKSVNLCGNALTVKQFENVLYAANLSRHVTTLQCDLPAGYTLGEGALPPSLRLIGSNGKEITEPVDCEQKGSVVSTTGLVPSVAAPVEVKAAASDDATMTY